MNKVLYSVTSSDKFWEKLTLLFAGENLKYEKGEWRNAYFMLQKSQPTGIKDVFLTNSWR